MNPHLDKEEQLAGIAMLNKNNTDKVHDKQAIKNRYATENNPTIQSNNAVSYNSSSRLQPVPLSSTVNANANPTAIAIAKNHHYKSAALSEIRRIDSHHLHAP